jgi:hypothetical protein
MVFIVQIVRQMKKSASTAFKKARTIADSGFFLPYTIPDKTCQDAPRMFAAQQRYAKHQKGKGASRWRS